MKVHRIGAGPIVDSASHESLGQNIQGPSLIKVPEWVENRLGDFYLYFANHKGRFIRLAYADAIEGPWSVHAEGSLQLGDSCFPSEDFEISDELKVAISDTYKRVLGDLSPSDVVSDAVTAHIASPDVHVWDEQRKIVMYFHGLEEISHQVTRVATSTDGIHFKARPEILGRTYFRAFEWGGYTYALAMPGQFYRSTDGLTRFEEGPVLFNKNMRHFAVRVSDGYLEVFWTQAGDAPERIYFSTIELTEDWIQWVESDPVEVLRPEFGYEGADLRVAPSKRGVAEGRVNEVRDPALFEDSGRLYLLYAVAGESGIAIAELERSNQ